MAWRLTLRLLVHEVDLAIAVIGEVEVVMEEVVGMMIVGHAMLITSLCRREEEVGIGIVMVVVVVLVVDRRDRMKVEVGMMIRGRGEGIDDAMVRLPRINCTAGGKFETD